MITLSVLVHEPFTMVQLNVAEVPATNPVTADVSKDGVVIVAVPAVTVQVPAPTIAVFPVRTLPPTLHKF